LNFFWFLFKFTSLFLNFSENKIEIKNQQSMEKKINKNKSKRTIKQDDDWSTPNQIRITTQKKSKMDSNNSDEDQTFENEFSDDDSFSNPKVSLFFRLGFLTIFFFHCSNLFQFFFFIVLFSFGFFTFRICLSYN
jgi:hypothetical protein